MPTRPTVISDAAIVKATGKTWEQWHEILAAKHAESMPHKAIAAWLQDEHQVPPWWCQMLTVRFEQVIGRRKPGEAGEGRYSVGVSVTRPSSMDNAMNWWLEKIKGLLDFDGIGLEGEPKLSQTDKWRYWRAKLSDGTSVYVNVTQKASEKASVQLTHEKLADDVAMERWRSYWKNFLNQ